MADTRDFDAIGCPIAHSCLAGRKDDEVEVAESSIVDEGVDAIAGEVWAAAGDDVGYSTLPGTKAPWVARWRIL